MIITYHREKLLNAIIYMANNKMFCGKTKLLKLLYFLDFKHFKQTAKSVTGLDYYAWEKGIFLKFDHPIYENGHSSYYLKSS